MARCHAEPGRLVETASQKTPMNSARCMDVSASLNGRRRSSTKSRRQSLDIAAVPGTMENQRQSLDIAAAPTGRSPARLAGHRSLREEYTTPPRQTVPPLPFLFQYTSLFLSCHACIDVHLTPTPNGAPPSLSVFISC